MCHPCVILAPTMCDHCITPLKINAGVHGWNMVGTWFTLGSPKDHRQKPYIFLILASKLLLPKVSRRIDKELEGMRIAATRGDRLP